ncbi:MAG TPA: hypothetical protein PLJ52_13530, partial [Tenuifilaceae bacterium]|nr:hypothetical protein [Tenuifilaceae bacterium]
MKRVLMGIGAATIILFSQCNAPQKKETIGSPITQPTVEKVKKQLVEKYGEAEKFRIDRGVSQAASLWRTTDGTETEFENFCAENFVSGEAEVKTLFDKLSYGFEILNGYFLRISKDLMRPLHLDWGPVTNVDMIFGGFSAGAHLSEDLFTNKIAFITALNFPNYSLKEKTEQGESWNRLQWAYARMGDMFTSRVPAELVQNYSKFSTEADTYISEYNIQLGKLVNDKGENLFPADLKLISHWGLRDEIKSQYANGESGIESQKMIYQVMKRIIDQSIPLDVINSDKLTWNPYSNEVTENGVKVEAKPEPDTRYQQVV